jgi:hypothetical protein
MTKLLSVSQYAKHAGKHASQVYTFINHKGMPFDEERNAKGKLVKRIDPEVADAWLKEYQSQNAAKKRQPKGPQAATPVGESAAPEHDYLNDPRFVVWNKGGERGWAALAVEAIELDELGFIDPGYHDPKKQERYKFLRLLSSYGKKFNLPATGIRQKIVQGEMFFIDPIQLVGFLVLQLARFKGDSPKKAIKLLEAAAVELQSWKEEREDAETRTENNPV